MRCPKCGKKVQKEVGVCFKCGTIVREEPKKEESIKKNYKTVKQTKEKKIGLNGLLFIPILFSVICMIVSFVELDYLTGLIAFVMTTLFAVAYLIGNKTIKTDQKWIRTIAIILSLAMIIPYFSLYDDERGKIKTFDWSDIVLSEIVPEPEKTRGIIYSNSRDGFDLKICDISVAEYYDYVELCQAFGYNIDKQDEEFSFDAFYSSGHKLHLYFYENEEKMKIEIKKPMKVSEIIWPCSELGKVVPVPESSIGKILYEKSDGFEIYIAETDKKEYNEYVKLCVETGFTVEYQKSDAFFSAKNKNGIALSVSYEGYYTMKVSAQRDDVSEPETTTAVEKVKLNLIASNTEVCVDVGDSLLFETFSHQDSIEGYDDFLYVSDNEDVAKMNFSEIENENTIYVTIEGVSVGETFVYVKSSKGEKISEKIKVIVSEPETERETEPETENYVYNDYESEKPSKSGITVYVTPYGERYHYSLSCAGRNGMARDLDDVKGIYEPCRSCSF